MRKIFIIKCALAALASIALIGGMMAFLIYMGYSVFCWVMPPKIYGLCGVELGEKWYGDYRQFLNSGAPVVKTLDDSGRVYFIQVRVSGVSLEEVLNMVQEKYDIRSCEQEFSNGGGKYSAFYDPYSDRVVMVWADGAYEMVTLTARDYGLEKLVEKESKQKKMRGL